jgi:HAE1 family hydrophobic/amphiphilic exporter-1
MDVRTAVSQAVKVRVRPIYMSTFTSIFGMVPLVFFPGAGSELYRGLGSVVIGGLAMSTIFTLFLIPPLFSLVYSLGAALKRKRQKE